MTLPIFIGVSMILMAILAAMPLGYFSFTTMDTTIKMELDRVPLTGICRKVRIAQKLWLAWIAVAIFFFICGIQVAAFKDFVNG
uniref:Uncharacterized protein n=1 Tax=Pseudomonas phage RVTF4 TaxID=3236931 RepID=A0AB39CDL1_9VIRU